MIHAALKSVLSFVLAVAASFAVAQEWPSRAVKFIVPVPPGGGTDLYARLLAQALSDSLKQPFVVENRPGAGGNIGAEAVVKLPSDGYTFFVSATGTMVVNPSLYRNLAFSLENDFVPIARGVTGPFVFISNSGLPFRTLSDLIAAARSKQGGLTFASAGTGSMTYLGVRMLEEAADVRFLNVPYKGMGQAYQDLVGGQVNFIFADVASALPHIRGGKVRALAVTSKTPLLPEAPTVADAGFRNFNPSNSFSAFARAGTPSAIVNRANAEINNAMRTPTLAAKLEASAMVPVFESPAEFAESLKRERREWAAFIERNGIRLEQ
jgi:tripartite-type tricarboxylate transporter receptor subunit TctC